VADGTRETIRIGGRGYERVNVGHHRYHCPVA
jgi:hypothetical protein